MTQSMVLALLSVPLLYGLLLAAGRRLKRRAGVPLDARYQLFSAALAAFVPLSFLPVHYELWRALLATVIVMGTSVLIGLLRRYYWEQFFLKRYQIEAPPFMRQVVNLILLAGAVLLLMYSLYDLRVPGLLAGSGIVAVVLGLAVQETLGNVIAGYSLHTGKPFRPGDWILLGDHHAEVMELNWRSARLRTTDHVYLDVPNSQLARQTVINFSYPTPVHAVRLQVGVDYKAPPNRVKDVLRHAATQAEGVLSHPPTKVFVHQFGDSAITYEVKFWISDHGALSDIQDSIRTNIWYELERAHIQIPYPIRTVQLERRPRTTPPQATAALTAALQKQPLFQCLDEAQRNRLVANAAERRFGRNERMIEEGGAGDSMFILLTGEAEVSVQRNGHTSQLAVLQAGACFGEMSLLTGEKRSATVTAHTDCEVLEITKDELGPILREQPQILEQLSQILAQRRLEKEAALKRIPQNEARAATQLYAKTFLDQVRAFLEL